MLKANFRVQIRMQKSAVHWSTEIKTEPASEIDLKEFVKKAPSENEKIDVLEQISLPLLEETTCGNIENIPAVMKDLRNIYCFILTDGKHDEYSEKLTVEDLQCSDPNVALDIIRKMGSPGEVTLQEILQHPFFWNDFLKIQFLCKVTDFINGRIKFAEFSQNDITEKYSLGYVADVVPECGWIEQLKLTRYEIRYLQTVIRKQGLEESHFAVGIDTIYNKAKKSEKKYREDKNSVFKLVKFLRNLAVYPSAYPSHMWNIFDGFPGGFWNFFSSRFPNLFMYVYTHMRAYILTSHTGGEFLNRRLPMMHIVSISFNKDSGFYMPETSFFNEGDEEIKEKKSVQKKPFASGFPKPFEQTFSSEPYMSGASFLVKEKTSPNEIRQVIDAEVESMRETKIFALEHQQLDEDSVKYFCSKLNSGFELSELKFKDCGVDKLFLSTLLDNNLEGKVKILSLSENKNLDFSMISELLAKLQCYSLDVSNMEFPGTDLGKLEVKKLILNCGTFSKSISLTLAELLKKGMEELSLAICNISCKQLIKEIYKTLSENEMLSLKVLDLSHIYLKEKESLEAISMIINRANGDFEKLCLFNCGIDADSLKAFTEIVDKKINEFDIGGNEKVIEEDMQAVIDVARKVEAEKLDLSSLSLKEHHIQQLKDSQLSSGKVSDLNLSDNSEIGGHVVGELVKAWGIKRLNISLCKFIEKDYKALVAALGNYKLESIRCNDLSRSVRCEEYTDILKKVTDQIFIKM